MTKWSKAPVSLNAGCFTGREERLGLEATICTGPSVSKHFAVAIMWAVYQSAQGASSCAVTCNQGSAAPRSWWNLESMGAGGKRDLADGDGHMEPGYVPGSLQRRPKTRKRKLSQLWRATQAFGRARPSLLPALVVDADLRPAAAECGSWMITFQDREACTCTASA